MENKLKENQDVVVTEMAIQQKTQKNCKKTQRTIIMNKTFTYVGNKEMFPLIARGRRRSKKWWKRTQKITNWQGDLMKRSDAPPNSLKDSNVSLKVETMEEGIEVRSLAHNTSKVREAWQNSGMGTRTSDKWVN